MLLNKYVLATTFLVVFGSSLLNAQVKPDGYDARWKLVDSLVNKKGLTQSALEQVNKIYATAKNEKNDAQLTKALVFRMNLQSASQDDATQKNIGELEKEIGSAQGPARSILTSILAGVYENYLDQNRYKLYNRTKTSGYKKEDIATWDLADLHKKIGELYLASIKDEGILWQTKLEPFEPIIIKGNVRKLRPTLLDLLAHRALDYFKSDERDIDKPAYAFEIDDRLAFAPLHVFASHPFRNADSLSLHFKALQLFQRLMIRHMPAASPAPLVDLDIERVQFIYQYGVMDHKDSLYMKALAGISGGYVGAGGATLESVLAQAWYLQAQQYANQAAAYDPAGDTSHRYSYVAAKAICEKVIAEKDSSEGRTNCQQLLQTILYKELTLQTEKVNMPGQPFRCLLSWRNFTNVYFRLAKVNRAQVESLGYNTYQDEYWTKLLQLPMLRNFAQGLPETGDHQGHRVEIKIDALPQGEYALVASADKDFSLHKNRLTVQYFTVSAIAFVNYGFDYFVVNRESGQPLAGAAVQAWDQG
ncbi:MAG TPA: alpha-2-macroglobulin, partial [Puia sp.]|nr:alpha-2-macroglobulin [Puia sp.]